MKEKAEYSKNSPVLLGAPSTGKTTIAELMAKEYSTVWMPEYGREYWEKHQIDRRLTLEQLLEIAEGHLSREEKLLYEANKYLFTDTATKKQDFRLFFNIPNSYHPVITT